MMLHVQTNFPVGKQHTGSIDSLATIVSEGGPHQVDVQKRNMANTTFKAVLEARFSRVKFILDNEGDSNLRNDRGQNLLITALHIPDDEKRDKMFKLLVRRGANCCSVDPSTGRDVLSWACILGRTKQVQRILQSTLGEIDLTRKDKQGMTALHNATKEGHLDVVKMLIEVMKKYRLSVDISDRQGLTPYIYARRLGHFGIADELIREGRCSPRQFDSNNHKSVEDWVEIGKKERKIQAKIQRQKLIAQYKIHGKLNSKVYPNTSDFKLPAITVSDSEGVTSTTSGTSMNSSQDIPSIPDNTSTKLKRGGFQNFDRMNNVNFYLPRISNKTPHIHTSLSDIHRKSMDAAFALMGLTQPEIVHPSHFVSSEFDTTKVTEYPSIISSMMDVLSSQQSDAYRVVAKAPTPPPLPVIVPKHKPKVSTLAILFGKNNFTSKYKRRKSKKMSVTSMKKEKSLSEHAKDKNRRKMSKK